MPILYYDNFFLLPESNDLSKEMTPPPKKKKVTSPKDGNSKSTEGCYSQTFTVNNTLRLADGQTKIVIFIF